MAGELSKELKKVLKLSGAKEILELRGKSFEFTRVLTDSKMFRCTVAGHVISYRIDRFGFELTVEMGDFFVGECTGYVHCRHIRLSGEDKSPWVLLLRSDCAGCPQRHESEIQGVIRFLL